MAKLNGKLLAKAHGISVAQSLYRARGDWYHVLNRFPAALFDDTGYIIFETFESYAEFLSDGRISGVNYSAEKNWLTIKHGISSQNGYVHFRANAFPNEVISATRFFEGSVQTVTVNRYERDRNARQNCIDAWGCRCIVCDFDFLKFYGEIGRDFIHVHHLVQISSIGSEYELDPFHDLRPVCPNCHAMLHRRDPPLSIEDLKKILKN